MLVTEAAARRAPAEGPVPDARLRALVLVIVWAISLGYMASRLKVGWVPHDEGTLGLSAERVLQGQLPHRDFDDYTGGLTFVHALAFRVLGVSSAAMRYVLFAFFVPWVPAVFYIASRFDSPIAAGAVTLTAIAWSVPNYPGPLPSWYNLFFATWGVAALFRHVDTGSRRWLFVAGLCGGLSMLAKVAAAYYVAGVLLFFLFREQTLSGRKNGLTPKRARLYRTAVTAGLTMFAFLLVRMIRSVPGFSRVVYFAVPALALVLLVVAREFAGVPGTDRERFAALFRLCAPFGAGIAIPLLLFLLPYAQAGALRELLHGLLATPGRAVQFAAFDPHNAIAMMAIVPFVVPLIVAYESGRIGRVVCGCVVAMYGCAILVFAGKATFVYFLGWSALGTVIPALIVAGTAMLWVSREHEKPDAPRQQQLMLLLSVTALCSVIQFPFSAPIYFFYVAPLVILSAMALFVSAGRPPKFVLAVLVGIYLMFPSLPVTAYQMGISHTHDGKTERLNVPRAGGLRVDASDARVYDQLIPLVQSHAAGKFTYAAPDCPEVYFLSGLQSPSQHYFEFAEVNFDQADWVLERLTRLGISVVAIEKKPRFADTLAGGLPEELEKRYSHSEDVGDFTVRWKEPL